MRSTRNMKRGLIIGAAGVLMAGTVATTLIVRTGASHAATAAQGNTAYISYVGDTAFGPASLGAAPSGTAGEIGPQQPEQDVHPTATKLGVTLPAGTGGGSASQSSSGTGFAGLNHFNSRTASNGNQFSLEPPDQGMCTNGKYVFEGLNDVVGVYSANGNHQLVAGPTALNAFFKLAPSIIRSSPPVFGPFTSDPKCYYDQQTNRWFVTMLSFGQNPSTGAFEAPTYEYIAVSKGGDPTGAFTVFKLDTTNPNGYSDCPCFGDQPLIGADANGFYITTNEFPLFAAGFNGAQVYAMSKRALEHAGKSGALPTVVHINAGALPAPSQTIGNTTYPGGPWYSIQPATTPPGGDFNNANGGTEFFLSSLDFVGAGDNRIAAWALTNTSSLNSEHPDVSLSNTVIGSVVYANMYNVPGGFAASQKAGSTPLADLLTASGYPTTEAYLNANDDRMNQVVYANGLLWSGVNTNTAAGTVGIAYFVVRPSFGNDSRGDQHANNNDGGTLSATMVKQGYVTVAGNNVLFPSVGVNAQGQGVIAFTLSGPDYYPSAAYAPINAQNGAGDVVISGAGVGPEDGFTGYKAYRGNGVSRWGDYSAAVAAPDGAIWTATEYIGQSCTDAQFNADTTCGGTRTVLANWGTYITRINVGDEGH